MKLPWYCARMLPTHVWEGEWCSLSHASVSTGSLGACTRMHRWSPAESRECDRYMFLHVDVCVCAGAEKNSEMPRFVTRVGSV